MNITEAKKCILDMLKKSGFKPLSPKGALNDFRIAVAPKLKNVLVLSTSDVLTGKEQSFFSDLCREAGVDCIITKVGSRITFQNLEWDDAVSKKKTSGSQTPAQDQSENVVAIAGSKRKYTRKLQSPESLPHLTPIINEEIANLSVIAERFETILDSFMLAKLSVREIATELYDSLRAEGMNIYSSNVEIKFSGNSLVVPHITKEAFVAVLVKIMASQRNINSFKQKMQ